MSPGSIQRSKSVCAATAGHTLPRQSRARPKVNPSIVVHAIPHGPQKQCASPKAMDAMTKRIALPAPAAASSQKRKPRYRNSSQNPALRDAGTDASLKESRVNISCHDTMSIKPYVVTHRAPKAIPNPMSGTMALLCVRNRFPNVTCFLCVHHQRATAAQSAGGSPMNIPLIMISGVGGP